jgi:thiol-disulfide isomerase/thioredoxin
MRFRIAFFLALLTYGNLAAQPQVVKLQRVLDLINNGDNKIQVINFWATWCAPCVKELPLFENLSAQNIQGVKVTLISLDLDLDPNPEKVYKFVTRKKILSEVLLLDEKDPNSWIDKIAPEWSGALPATLIVNTETGARRFLERELHEGEIEKFIRELKE